MTSGPVIEARGIAKRYGPATALAGVDFAVHPGEVVGLVGDNGAGKSTLIKILSGALEPTEGEVLIDGTPVRFDSPRAARGFGIETVYQDLALAPDLTVAENVFIGRELKRGGMRGWFGALDRKTMNQVAAEQLARLRIRIDAVTDRADSLSGGQRQAIAVARAVAWGRRVLLMDEPTAALGVEEQQRVAELIRDVRGQGIPVVLISHNIPQVHEICDRVVVLWHGRAVADLRPENTSLEEIITWITGAAMAGGRTSGE